MNRRSTLRRDSAAALTEHPAGAVAPAREQAQPIQLGDYEIQYSLSGYQGQLFTYPTTSRYWSVETSSTWVKSRGQSLRQAGGAAGQPVVLELTPTRDDWYGLVLTSNGYQGDFTLSRTTL